MMQTLECYQPGRYWVIVLVTLISMTVSAQENKVYRTLDGNGNPVFSDAANEAAEEIELQDPAVYAPDPRLNLSPAFRKTIRLSPGPAYSTLSITSPGDDTAIRSNSGNLQVRFELIPHLQQNHSIQLLVDGAVTRTTKSASGITLTNLDRGTHQFLVQVIEDGSGEVLQTSPGISTTILRFSSILFKQRQAQRERKPK